MFYPGRARRSNIIRARDVVPRFTTPDQVLASELSSPATLTSRRGFMSRGAVRSGQSSFKKVKQRGSVAKWSQTVDGIPVYGSVITTHNDKFGEFYDFNALEFSSFL